MTPPTRTCQHLTAAGTVCGAVLEITDPRSPRKYCAGHMKARRDAQKREWQERHRAEHNQYAKIHYAAKRELEAIAEPLPGLIIERDTREYFGPGGRREAIKAKFGTGKRDTSTGCYPSSDSGVKHAHHF